MLIKSRKHFIIFKIIIPLILIFFVIYVNDYYKADLSLMSELTYENTVKYRHTDDNNNIIYSSEVCNDIGFIFYPGGKVEYTAYEPLMIMLAKQGIQCVLVEMPFNLAVLNENAAEGIQQKYPNIKNWYIGGHSLGGTMAASYLAKNTNEFEGLILLASYSISDLTQSDLAVLSIYESEDGVLNSSKYQEEMINLPSNFSEFVINGGNHAYFGIYGEQKGDGEANITNNEQIQITASKILEFINAK